MIFTGDRFGSLPVSKVFD
uniref:Uncharacterized protein n=1 Tax=Anguilla anguilla TaxID=7936 RepID=A0A0E9VQZ5_ANGAN